LDVAVSSRGVLLAGRLTLLFLSLLSHLTCRCNPSRSTSIVLPPFFLVVLIIHFFCITVTDLTLDVCGSGRDTQNESEASTDSHAVLDMETCSIVAASTDYYGDGGGVA
jgi:hypothetical protein